MATVKFSVPDDVKTAFDREFNGQNRNAVIADLMRRAVAEAIRRRRVALFHALTAGRRSRPSATDEELRSARCQGRS